MLIVWKKSKISNQTGYWLVKFVYNTFLTDFGQLPHFTPKTTRKLIIRTMLWSYRNQSIDVLSKSADWCLYDWDIKNYSGNCSAFYSLTSKKTFRWKWENMTIVCTKTQNNLHQDAYCKWSVGRKCHIQIKHS